MVNKIYNHQEYADGVIIRTDDVSLTLEENSTTYSGVDAVLTSNQSFHVIVDANNDGQSEGGFTVRTQGQTVDTSIERFKIQPNGYTTLTNTLQSTKTGTSILVPSDGSYHLGTIGKIDRIGDDLRIYADGGITIGAGTHNGADGIGIQISNVDQAITFNEEYQFPLTDGANGTFLISNGQGQLYFGYQTNVEVANTIAEGTGVTLTPLAGSDGWVINIGQPVETTANVIFNVVNADVNADIVDTNTISATQGNITTVNSSVVNATSGNITTLDTTNATIDQLTIGSGVLTWNNIDGTLDVDYGDVTLQLGQEQHFYAKATEAINNGDVVMFAGAQGDHLLIAKADMSSVGFIPEYIIGVATQDFAINEFGYVTSFGKVRDLNTSVYSEGALLYLDPNTAGGVVTTKPSVPNHVILVAAVTRSHATEGTIFVRVSESRDTDEVPEGLTNLYYTDERARASVSVSGDLLYDSNTGVISFTERTNAEVRELISVTGDLTYNSNTGVIGYTTPTTIQSLSNHSTDDLVEGNTNLYFTTERARAAISVGGDLSYANGVISYTATPHYDTSNFNTDFAAKSTTDLAEGSNLYYTDARVMTSLGSVDTSIIPSGNEVYDLGSPTNRFRDLYLSSSTIFLGSTTISANGSVIELPSGTKVGGVEITTGEANTVVADNSFRGGTATYDCSSTLEFRERDITSDITTIQLNNLTLTDLQKKVVKIQIIQGETAYIPSTLQIGSDIVPVFWSGGVVPTGTSEGVDTLSFEITKEQFNNKYYVIGSINSTKLTPPSYTAPTRVTSGLVLEYNIEDPSSFYNYFGNTTKIKDLSGNNKFATLSGGWQSFDNQNYLDFFGGQFITEDLSDVITTEAHTVEIWLNIDSYNSKNAWSYLGQNGTTGYQTSGLHFVSAGPFALAQSTVYDGDTNQRISTGSGSLTGVWKQYTRTFNGTTHTGYLNGSQVDSQVYPWTSPHIDSGLDFRIGFGIPSSSTYQNVNTGAYDGKFGFIRVYNRQLSTAEVLSNFNSTKSIYGIS